MFTRSRGLVLGCALLAGCGGKTEGQLAGGTDTADGGLSPDAAVDGFVDAPGLDAQPDVKSDAVPDVLADVDTGLDYEERVVRACATAASCGTDPGPGTWLRFTPSHCVDQFGQLDWPGYPSWTPDDRIAQKLLDCAELGPDCAAFRACFGGDWLSLSPCREGALCEGNSMTTMDGGPTFDCGAIESTCMDLWSGALRACCNEQPCVTTTDVTCSGTTATWCGGWGEFMSVDCGASGRVCGSDPLAPCVGTGASCDETDLPVCDGSVVTFCSGGRLATFDCAATVFRTACGQDSYAVCVPAGSACDPTYYEGTCEGSRLSVCVDGAEQWVDCENLGFDWCAAPTGGYARCVFAE